ncbi:hypothetical protein F511_26912 [Dorcoceras hygrometricum]|uniref:Uncharacterized protein n=1 Tax=Dorcoceras hygrometricum TaxID=472368 RepID=A0A2Z7D7C3_9LAMI|nr:hypothetical protein F511_26912 [Dorcoceras hygrometricum]
MAYVILSVNRYLATGLNNATDPSLLVPDAILKRSVSTYSNDVASHQRLVLQTKHVSLPRSLSQLRACCQQQPSQAQLLPDATQDITLTSSLLIYKINQTRATVLLTRVDFCYKSLLLIDFANNRYVCFLY